MPLLEMSQNAQTVTCLRPGELSKADAADAHAQYLFKVILIGASGVGKTSLARRCDENTFSLDTKSTIGCEFFSKTLEMPDGVYVRIQVWDTAGQERFRAVSHQYYRGVHGVIGVFALDDRDSLLRLESYLGVVRESNPALHYQCMVVGNKNDVPWDKRQVTREDARTVAEANQCAYLETSAKDDADTSWHVFYGLATHLYATYKKHLPEGTEAHAPGLKRRSKSLEHLNGRRTRAIHIVPSSYQVDPDTLENDDDSAALYITPTTSRCCH